MLRLLAPNATACLLSPLPTPLLPRCRSLDYNYFLCLPLASPGTIARFEAFRDQVLADPGAAAAGVPRPAHTRRHRGGSLDSGTGVRRPALRCAKQGHALPSRRAASVKAALVG